MQSICHAFAVRLITWIYHAYFIKCTVSPPTHICVEEESGREELWEECEGQDYEETEFDIEPATNPPPLPESTLVDNRSQRALVLWLVGFQIQLQAKHYISDSALSLLLRFLHTFFRILGRFCGFVATMASEFPSTLHWLKRTYALPYAHHFTRFVVCHNCWKLYHYGECVIKTGSRRSSKVCNHIKYPMHPYSSGRRECGHPLLKNVQLVSGRNLLYPFKVYCYKSIQSSLQELLLRPGFQESCQHWKSRTVSDTLSDVDDSKLWKKNLMISGHPFSWSSFQTGIDAKCRLVPALQTRCFFCWGHLSHHHESPMSNTFQT